MYSNAVGQPLCLHGTSNISQSLVQEMVRETGEVGERNRVIGWAFLLLPRIRAIWKCLRNTCHYESCPWIAQAKSIIGKLRGRQNVFMCLMDVSHRYTWMWVLGIHLLGTAQRSFLVYTFSSSVLTQQPLNTMASKSSDPLSLGHPADGDSGYDNEIFTSSPTAWRYGLFIWWGTEVKVTPFPKYPYTGTQLPMHL